VSDVFETAAGYHLVRVSRRRDAVERSLDQLAETVRAKVRAERYEAAKAAYLAALRTGSGR
jgi:parvulin-like peptidyl-prolyl isomerase